MQDPSAIQEVPNLYSRVLYRLSYVPPLSFGKHAQINLARLHFKYLQSWQFKTKITLCSFKIDSNDPPITFITENDENSKPSDYTSLMYPCLLGWKSTHWEGHTVVPHYMLCGEIKLKSNQRSTCRLTLARGGWTWSRSGPSRTDCCPYARRAHCTWECPHRCGARGVPQPDAAHCADTVITRLSRIYYFMHKLF